MEFVCKAKNNLVRLVKDRLEKKYDVQIVLGELIIDDDDEQWITVTGGTIEQQRETKTYLTTLCNSEDACILSYEPEYHQALLDAQDRIEMDSGACLVFPQSGNVNLYGSDLSVTLALTALEDMKEKLARKEADFPESLPEDELNEQLKIKCNEHDLNFEDYANSSICVKRTLFRWLSQDMDKSDSLIDTSAVSVDRSDTNLELNSVTVDDFNASDCVILDRHVATSPITILSDSLDRTLGEDVTDSRLRIILNHGYTTEEFDKVRNEIGNDKDISTILTKLLENRQKKGIAGAESKSKSTSMKAGTSGEHQKQAGNNKPVPERRKETTPDDDDDDDIMIDLTDESTDLMVYFENFFDEEPGLSREELLKRNIKRQQILMAEVQRRNSPAKSQEAGTGETPPKKKRGKKKKTKKKTKASPAKASSSKKLSDSSSEEDNDDTVLNHPSQLHTIDATGFDNTVLMNESMDLQTTVIENDAAPRKKLADLAALYPNVVDQGQNNPGSLVNELGLAHSPMAENQTNKKKQRTVPSTAPSANTSMSSPFRDTIIGGQDLSMTAGGPMHSTPVATAPKARLGARFDALQQLQDDYQQNQENQRPVVGRGARSPSDDRRKRRPSAENRRHPSGENARRPPSGDRRTRWSSPVRDPLLVYEPPRVPMPMSDYQTPAKNNLRPIVIDGPNVACAHGRKKMFSCKGILLAVQHFQSRGHKDVTVFVPNWRRGGLNAKIPTVDGEILNDLEGQGIVCFTPSRYLNGEKLVSYDDRFIIELAARNDGVVVSNDNYRDLVNENPSWRKVIETRLVMYTFAGDHFMVPDDPLGPKGPRLQQMLTKTNFTSCEKISTKVGRHSRADQRFPGAGLPLAAPGAPGPSGAMGPPPPLLSIPTRQPPSRYNGPAPGGPGAPSFGFDGQATWARPLPTPAPPCRTIAQTETLYRQLLEIFPTIPSIVQRILDNHINETDITKLSTHILDVIK